MTGCTATRAGPSTSPPPPAPSGASWRRLLRRSDRPPADGRWLNAVEGFFAKLTKRRLKRGVFHSLIALQTAINSFIEHHNHGSKPFHWRADPQAIIAAAKRGHQTLETIH